VAEFDGEFERLNKRQQIVDQNAGGFVRPAIVGMRTVLAQVERMVFVGKR